jgi:hypothetical protein
MSLTKLSLGWNNDVIYKLFPPRESLDRDIPAGDWNIEKLFLRCMFPFTMESTKNVIIYCNQECEGRANLLLRFWIHEGKGGASEIKDESSFKNVV